MKMQRAALRVGLMVLVLAGQASGAWGQNPAELPQAEREPIAVDPNILEPPPMKADLYKGSDNVERFLGKWNLWRDGWAHSLEITFNPSTDWDTINPLIIRYFNAPGCQGSPAGEQLVHVRRMIEAPRSSYLHFELAGGKFDGYIFSRGGSKAMAGVLEDAYGKFGWYAVKTE